MAGGAITSGNIPRVNTAAPIRTRPAIFDISHTFPFKGWQDGALQYRTTAGAPALGATAERPMVARAGPTNGQYGSTRLIPQCDLPFHVIVIDKRHRPREGNRHV